MTTGWQQPATFLAGCLATICSNGSFDRPAAVVANNGINLGQWERSRRVGSFLLIGVQSNKPATLAAIRPILPTFYSPSFQRQPRHNRFPGAIEGVIRPNSILKQFSFLYSVSCLVVAFPAENIVQMVGEEVLRARDRFPDSQLEFVEIGLQKQGLPCLIIINHHSFASVPPRAPLHLHRRSRKLRTPPAPKAFGVKVFKIFAQKSICRKTIKPTFDFPKSNRRHAWRSGDVGL